MEYVRLKVSDLFYVLAALTSGKETAIPSEHGPNGVNGVFLLKRGRHVPNGSFPVGQTADNRFDGPFCTYVINRKEHSRCCASRNDWYKGFRNQITHIVTISGASNVNEKMRSGYNGCRRKKILHTVGNDPKGLGRRDRGCRSQCLHPETE
jgi:hypothetical protein